MKAAMIVAGLIMTTGGLLSGRWDRRRFTSTRSRTLTPVEPGDLTTVIVATIGRDSLRQTVLAALRQSYSNIEVVVVDNTPSTGRVPLVLQGIEDPRLRIVSERKKGVAAARNKGIRSSRGDVIAFTDDDALPSDNWIEVLNSVYGKDPEGTLGAITGRVIGTDIVTPEQEWFEEAQIFDKGELSRVFSFPVEQRPGEMDAAVGPRANPSRFFPYTCGEVGSGNNMSVRREVLTEVGMFDETLGAGTIVRGGEDLDMLRRIVRSGWKIAYRPDVVVRHTHRSELTELRSQMYAYGVGMSAVLTKVAVGGDFLGILRLIPSGLAFLLSPRSGHNDKKPAAMPKSLILIEFLGYLAGPYVYAKSLAQQRRRCDVSSVSAGAES